MRKHQIVDIISSETGIEKAKALDVVNLVMKIVKESLIGGESVFLRGFGTFFLKQKAKKKGRSFKTGQTIDIPAHKIPAFKPSKPFSNTIKEKTTE